MTARTPASQDLRSFVDRIERLEQEVKDINSDKSDLYAEAKGTGFDVKALKAVIARRRKDPADLAELDGLIETYLAALESGTVVALRARTHEAMPGADAPPRADAIVTPAADDDGIPGFLDRRTPAALPSHSDGVGP